MIKINIKPQKGNGRRPSQRALMEGMVDRNGRKWLMSVLRSIIYQVYHIENSYPKPYKIQFLWCPGHSQVVGNEKTHLLAQKSTKKEKAIQSNQSPPPLLQTVALTAAWARFPLSLYARTANSKSGKFTKSIDKAPSPFRHTRSL